jgi:hypothetical protein
VLAELSVENDERVAEIVARGDSEVVSDGALEAVATDADGESENIPVPVSAADVVKTPEERADVDEDEVELLEGVVERVAGGDELIRADEEVDVLKDGFGELVDERVPEDETLDVAVTPEVKDATEEELDEGDGAADADPVDVLESCEVAVIRAVRDAESTALLLTNDAVAGALEEADAVGNGLSVW